VKRACARAADAVVVALEMAWEALGRIWYGQTPRRTQRFLDRLPRAGWDRGPWAGEDDWATWTTPSGLPGLILRHPQQGDWLCYAAVPPWHPLWGADFGTCPDPDCGNRNHAVNSLYWPGNEINFSGYTYPEMRRPETDDEPTWWWYGLDNNHSWNFAPALEAQLAAVMPNSDLHRYRPDRPDGFRAHYVTQDEAIHITNELARNLAGYRPDRSHSKPVLRCLNPHPEVSEP
jgi:hypothetical protein